MRFALAALAFVAGATPAAAQPQLYGPQPPAGSAFLRLVNATDGPVSARLDGVAIALPAGGPARVGTYRVLPRAAGRAVPLELRGADGTTARTTLRAEPGAYVTVLLHGNVGTLTAVPAVDMASFDQSRALLAFYNTLPDCPAATLALDGGAAVFPDVPAGESRRRTVNPVTASLRAVCGDRATPAFPLGGVEAGGRFSAWLLPGEAGPQAFVTRDAVPGGWQPGGSQAGR